MILVSVGTHHQPFDRLLLAADRLAASTDEPVVVQRGCSTLALPRCAMVVDQVPPERLSAWMSEARVVVLHAGSSSFLEARALGRVPILVPRRAGFGEHVDDHQVEFARSLPLGEARVVEPEELVEAVASWSERRDPPHDRSAAFADRLGALIEGLVAGRGERNGRRRR